MADLIAKTGNRLLAQMHHWQPCVGTHLREQTPAWYSVANMLPPAMISSNVTASVAYSNITVSTFACWEVRLNNSGACGPFKVTFRPGAEAFVWTSRGVGMTVPRTRDLAKVRYWPRPARNWRREIDTRGDRPSRIPWPEGLSCPGGCAGHLDLHSRPVWAVFCVPLRRFPRWPILIAHVHRGAAYSIAIDS